VAFVFAGQALFRWLGIGVQDFMIAGGILLLAFAMRDLLTMEKSIPRVHRHTVGAVPIGVPLMVGPAVLTTSILLADQHGYLLTLAAIFTNILIAGIAFCFSRGINRLLGLTGVRTVSKVVSVILAAYGVMMVRRGCLAVVETLSQLAT
jgi:multiple antibiotic resistance protein